MLGRHFTLALLALLTGSVAAWSNENIANSEHIPVQPQETPLTDQTMTGLAPQITMAPEHPRYGLMPRVEFSKPSNVCGYNPANGFPLSCAGRFDTCAYNSPPYAGCCQNGIGCTSIPVKCIGYNDVLAGSCNPKTFTDRKTACCDRTAPHCVAYTLTSAKVVMSVWGCSSIAKIGVELVTSNPFWQSSQTVAASSKTASGTTSAAVSGSISAASVTDSSSQETNTSSAEDKDQSSGSNNDGAKSTNIGAIVGGVVGGIAGLGLVGLAAFLLIRQRNNSKKKAEGPPEPPMGQTEGSLPPPKPTPSPSAYSYQAGGYTPVSPHDPNMNYQQQPYSPQDSTYPPQQQQQQHLYSPQQDVYSPQQQAVYSPSQQQAAYSPQQQSAYSPSPIQAHTEFYKPQNGTQPSELAGVEILGSPNNRAELAST